jgi:hypothetical protein
LLVTHFPPASPGAAATPSSHRRINQVAIFMDCVRRSYFLRPDAREEIEKSFLQQKSNKQLLVVDTRKGDKSKQTLNGI